MTNPRISAFAAAPPYGARLAVASIGRAATNNLAALEHFYVDGVGAKVSLNETDVNANVSKRCFVWPGAAADVCFTRRPPAAAADDDFSVLDLENILKQQHETWLTGKPNCAMDRWVDNHYAVDVPNNFDHLLEFVLENDVLYTCADGPAFGAHYIFDPTGWGIQLDVSFTVAMPGCGESRGGHHPVDRFQMAPLARKVGIGIATSMAPAGVSLWCEGGVC